MKLFKKSLIVIPALATVAPIALSGCTRTHNEDRDVWFSIQKIDFNALPWPKIYYEFTVDVTSLSQKKRSGSQAEIYDIKKINSKLWTVEINAYFDHDDVVTIITSGQTKKLYFSFNKGSKEYSLTDKE